MDIQIDIDDRHFTDVAPVVDREDFSKEIERLRSVLKPIIQDIERNPSKIISKSERGNIDSEIDKSRKRLYLPIVFGPVIEAVVFNNCVTDIDYSPAYLDRKSDGTFDKQGATPDDTYFIVLSPGARDKDVINAYQKYRDELGNVKGASKYKYIHRVWEVSKNKPSLKKYREWYQAIKAGDSYAGIAEKETKKCPMPDGHKTGKKKSAGCTCYEESTIRKGVATYESLVWKTRTS